MVWLGAWGKGWSRGVRMVSGLRNWLLFADDTALVVDSGEVLWTGE